MVRLRKGQDFHGAFVLAGGPLIHGADLLMLSKDEII